MIQNVRNWNEAHALLMLVAAGIALGTRDLLPMLLLSVVSFGILVAVGYRQIAHLRPAGGIANWITFARLLILLGIVWKADALPVELFVGLALLVVIADGLDGWMARRLNQQTEFGASLDLEVDALYAALFSLFVFLRFDIGGWVVVAGLMRYGFVFVLIGLRWTDRPKVVMKEGKTIAVLFFLALLTPFVLPLEWAWWILLIGSGAIIYSFLKEFVLLAKGSV